METQKAYDREDPKMVYYMSMEFLMGRALGNNIINLKATEPVKGALEELGIVLFAPIGQLWLLFTAQAATDTAAGAEPDCKENSLFPNA